MLAEKLRAAATTSTTASIITYVGGYTFSFAGTTSTTSVSLTSLTGGAGSAPITGDLVIVYYGVGSTANRTLSATDYIQVAEITRSGGYDANLYVGYKFMGPTPDTTLTLSSTGSVDDAGVCAISVWRNVDLIIEQDTTATTATSALTTRPNPPAITPVTTGTVIVSGGTGACSAANLGTFTSSNLSGFITASSSDTNSAAIGLGYNQWSGGSFDPALFGFTGTDTTQGSAAAVTLALRPTGTNFVGTASAETVTGGSVTVNKPTGTTSGDLLIAVMSAGSNNQTWTGDTGWTEAADSGLLPDLRVAYKVAGGSEPSTYTFTGSFGAGSRSAIILTVRGLSYTSIGAFGTIQTTSPVTVSASLTTTVSPAVLLYLAGSSGATTSWTTPTDMNYINQEIGSSGSSTIIFSQYTTAAASTAFTKSSTYTGTDRSNAIIVELS